MKKTNPFILVAPVVFCIAIACSKAKAPDVLDQKDNGSTTSARTTQCTTPNADGVRCDVKTCKADAASDCAQFKEGCVNYNHTYSGDDKSGTCTRGPLIGRMRPNRFQHPRVVLDYSSVDLRFKARTCFSIARFTDLFV